MVSKLEKLRCESRKIEGVQIPESKLIIMKTIEEFLEEPGQSWNLQNTDTFFKGHAGRWLVYKANPKANFDSIVEEIAKTKPEIPLEDAWRKGIEDKLQKIVTQQLRILEIMEKQKSDMEDYKCNLLMKMEILEDKVKIKEEEETGKPTLLA